MASYLNTHLETYIRARQHGDRDTLDGMLVPDCVTIMNSMTLLQSELRDIGKWERTHFATNLNLQEVIEVGEIATIRWTIDMWFKKISTPVSQPDPPHTCTGIEILEFDMGKIARRLLAFDSSYFWKCVGW